MSLPDAHRERIDHIPVIWIEPQESQKRRLVIFLNHLGGRKEATFPYLQDLAAKGFVALSFDAWQHGERGMEQPQELNKRVFSNFRRHMWPILGQTTLDTLRVIDWAVSELHVDPEIYMGGLSMGGDVAVAAAGVDKRIVRVAAVVSTPDWTRPGMADPFSPGNVLQQGIADSYAQYFYVRLNPITHLASYAHAPEIHFLCGEKDTHVPIEAAYRFQASLKDAYPNGADNITISLIPNFKHLDIKESALWWPECLAWLAKV